MTQLRTVFMFGGQGSHYRHMARELYANVALFREHLQLLDGIATRRLGQSVVAAMYDERCSRGDAWERLLVTHPAIYMVQSALVRALEERGVVPDLLLGASLGTYVAAGIGGALTEEQALELVMRQAQVIEAHAPHGGMTAVLAAPDLYHTSTQLYQNVELAGTSFHSHFVISGPPQGLTGAEAFLKQRGITYQRLAVAYPFHSRWIDPLQQAYMAEIAGVEFRVSRWPLVCCAHGDIVSAWDSHHAWHIVRKPIRFRETIAHLERSGPYRYIDLSPSATLAAFVKYNLPATSRSLIQSVLSPFGRDLAGLVNVQAAVAGSAAPSR